MIKQVLLSVLFIFTVGSIAVCQEQEQAIEKEYQLTPLSESPEIISNETLQVEFGANQSGELNEEKDARLELMIQDYMEQKEIEGYRVQLYSGQSRLEAMQIKTSLVQKEEKVKTYLIYKQPNFKIRLGDFKDRFQAQKQLLEYKEEYPGAFIVKDAIEATEIQRAP